MIHNVTVRGRDLSDLRGYDMLLIGLERTTSGLNKFEARQDQ